MKFEPITKENWEEASLLRPKQSQYKFIRRDVVIHSLARCYVQEDRPDKSVPYLIVHKGKFIGTFLFRNYGRGCNLTSFFIDRKYQGKGLGRQAVTAYISWVQRNYPNAQEIELCVSPKNAAARKLYESFGFEYTGEVSKLGNLYMELQLEKTTEGVCC
jgi:RimJ/RimL family protein N-acetyltransferase